MKVSHYVHSNQQYKRLVPLVAAILKHRVGAKKAILQGEILRQVRKNVPSFSARQLRKAIHEIRINHVLCGLVWNRGFYIEHDPEKLKAYALRLAKYKQAMEETHDAIIHDYWTLKNQ